MKRMIDNKDYEELKNNVDDINNKELPKYVKYVKENGAYTTYIHNENDENTKIAGVEFVKTQDENNMIESAVIVDETGVFMATNKKVSGVLTTHTLKLDHDGNLTLDDNAVGGGSKLYQHVISVNNWSLIITNNISTKLTFSQLREYLYNNGCRGYSTTYPASGVAWADSKLCPIFGCFAASLTSNISMVYRSGQSNYASEEISSVVYSTDWDKVIEL